MVLASLSTQDAWKVLPTAATCILDAPLRSDPQTDVLRVLIEHPSRSVYVRLLIYVPSHMELKRGRFAEADSKRATYTAILQQVLLHQIVSD